MGLRQRKGKENQQGQQEEKPGLAGAEELLELWGKREKGD